MKKNSALKQAELDSAAKDLPGRIKDHEHIHAANCGHRSYVHGDHIDYEHDGHFHYVKDGKTYDCPGPSAKVLPFAKAKR